MFIIEKISDNYVEEAALLFNLYREFYGKPTELQLARDFISSRVANDDSTIIIARKDDEIVGFMQLYPTFSSLSAKKSLVLNDLFVINEYRGKGLGQLLIDAANAYCRESGAKGLALSTAIDNTTAQSLYEKNGYVRDTEFYHYYKAI